MIFVLFLLIWYTSCGAVPVCSNSHRGRRSMSYSRYILKMSNLQAPPVVVDINKSAAGILKMRKKISGIPAKNKLSQYLMRKLSIVRVISPEDGRLLSQSSLEVRTESSESGIAIVSVSEHSIAEISIPPLAPSPSQILSWLQVQDSGVKGKGLFTVKCLQQGTLLGKYLGEVLTQKEFTARYPKGDAEYVFLVSEDVQRRDKIYVDAVDEMKSNKFRYVNHDSLDPNVIVEVHFTEGKNKELKKEEGKVNCEERTGVTNEEVLCTDSTGGANPSRTIEIEVKAAKEKEGEEGKDVKKKSKKDRTSNTSNFEIRMITARVVEGGEELCFDYGPLYSPSNGWTL